MTEKSATYCDAVLADIRKRQLERQGKEVTVEWEKDYSSVTLKWSE